MILSIHVYLSNVRPIRAGTSHTNQLCMISIYHASLIMCCFMCMGSHIPWIASHMCCRYDRGPHHRVKSRLSPMDRPKFPRDIINTQDSEMWRVMINQEQRGSGGCGGGGGDSVGYLFSG